MAKLNVERTRVIRKEHNVTVEEKHDRVIVVIDGWVVLRIDSNVDGDLRMRRVGCIGDRAIAGPDGHMRQGPDM